MTLNEILARQNVLNAILIKDGDSELSKALKVKIVRLRIALNKIKKQFDEDVQEFTKDLIPEELKALQAKPEDERTIEDTANIEKLVNKVNSEYNEFILQKGEETIPFETNIVLTDSDFDEIIAVNVGNEVEINGNKVKAEELMDVFYTFFIDNN